MKKFIVIFYYTLFAKKSLDTRYVAAYCFRNAEVMRIRQQAPHHHISIHKQTSRRVEQ